MRLFVPQVSSRGSSIRWRIKDPNHRRFNISNHSIGDQRSYSIRCPSRLAEYRLLACRLNLARDLASKRLFSQNFGTPRTRSSQIANRLPYKLEQTFLDLRSAISFRIRRSANLFRHSLSSNTGQGSFDSICRLNRCQRLVVPVLTVARGLKKRSRHLLDLGLLLRSWSTAQRSS